MQHWLGGGAGIRATASRRYIIWVKSMSATWNLSLSVTMSRRSPGLFVIYRHLFRNGICYFRPWPSKLIFWSQTSHRPSRRGIINTVGCIISVIAASIARLTSQLCHPALQSGCLSTSDWVAAWYGIGQAAITRALIAKRPAWHWLPCNAGCIFEIFSRCVRRAFAVHRRLDDS